MARGKGGGAPVGNKNAAGPRDKGGARSAIVGSLVGGPLGAGLSGAYVGAAKTPRAMSRHIKTSTALGAIGGGIVGTAAFPIIGTAVGATAGGLFNYAGAKVGQAVGKNAVKKRK